MRALEARYHPLEKESPTFIVIGHIVWDDPDSKTAPRVAPAPSLAKQVAPATMLATLKHLVRMTSPHTFRRLQTLHSRFWSFVEVETPHGTTRAA